MRTKAIIVGINAYKHAPLTASVNDAVKMCDALIKRNIVDQSDCVLLTAPLVESAADQPTRAVLGKRLYEARENKEDYDRLIVFFSGHGEFTFADIDLTRPRTVILPVDYEGQPYQRDLNIDVDELLDLFRLAGPKEQIFIFDCCRKQAKMVGKDAGGGSLMWPSITTGAERAQAALYGVSLKGEARAKTDELGLMTKHLLTGLDEAGMALDYFLDLDRFGITIETLAAHVEDGVRSELKNESGWEANYDLPTLVPRGPRTSFLLTKLRDEVPLRPLSVVIEPAEAVPVAHVCLLSGGNPFKVWPPNAVTVEVTLRFAHIQSGS